MQFSKVILKSAFVASALAAPISVEVDANSVVGTVESAAQGFMSKTGLSSRNIPDVGAAVNGVAGLVSLPSVVPTADLSASISSTQAIAEGIVSTVPVVSEVESAVQGPVSGVVGAVGSTGALDTVTSIVRRALDALSLVDPSST